jgi:uncharacterized protein with HEPN domain
MPSYATQKLSVKPLNIFQDARERHPQVEWRKISGLRDIVIHEYLGIDDRILWDVIQNHVPRLLTQIQEILTQSKNSHQK